MRVYARQGDTLDLLCWRHLARTAGAVERALQINHGLADHGPVLPHGTAVDLPEPSAVPAAERPLVQLWS